MYLMWLILYGIVFVCTAVHVLWWYESADHRAAIRHKAHSDARVVSAGKTSPFYCLLLHVTINQTNASSGTTGITLSSYS